MKAFYLAYTKIDALRRELTWTHNRLLLRVEKLEARSFYEVEAVNARRSTRELKRQIDSLLFERLALSRDKAEVMEPARKGHVPRTRRDFKAVNVFTFIGRDARKFRKEKHFRRKAALPKGSIKPEPKLVIGEGSGSLRGMEGIK